MWLSFTHGISYIQVVDMLHARIHEVTPMRTHRRDTTITTYITSDCTSFPGNLNDLNICLPQHSISFTVYVSIVRICNSTFPELMSLATEACQMRKGISCIQFNSFSLSIAPMKLKIFRRHASETSLPKSSTLIPSASE